MVSVAIIGAGRVGLALAIAIVRANGQLVVVANRSPGGCARASALLKKVPVVALGSPLPPADLLLICVRDEAIARIDVGKFAGTVAHVSGALPASVLARTRNIASIHPLLAIADAERGAELIPKATFGIEGDIAGMDTARAFVKRFGGAAFELKASQKAAYHAAAVLASNAVVATVDAAVELAASSVTYVPHASPTLATTLGQSPKDAVAAALAVLARSAVDNIIADGITSALTGPVVRGDAATVREHMDAIPLGPVRELYIDASLRMLAIARSRGLDPAAAQAVETVLMAGTGVTPQP